MPADMRHPAANFVLKMATATYGEEMKTVSMGLMLQTE
jgi:hypothetical protein